MSSAAAVAAGHEQTAQAGADILAAGGNAVDAAVGAMVTAFATEPVLTAAGGGGFMLISDGSRSTLYDGFAAMPRSRPLQGIDPELTAIPIDFGDTVQTFHIGQGSVASPSLPAMLFRAHAEHGRMPLREVLAPGIAAARDGIILNELQASFIGLLKPILTRQSACAALHAPDRDGHAAGSLLTAGELFRNRDLANTLEMLAIEGIEEMYHGDLARSIVKACMPYGLLGMEDLAAEQVTVRKPLSIRVLGGSLLTNPPPSSGGLLIAYAATMLDRLTRLPDYADTPWPLLATEGLRAASMLRCERLDARIYEDDIAASMLASPHIEASLQQIRNRLDGEDSSGADEPDNRHGSTTHISVIDSDGLAVSMTSSNGEGSGIVVPGTGIHLNNMLGEEDINPLGLHALAPGKRLSSMMAPSIFTEDGHPTLIFGSGGSNRLRGAILQVLLRHKLLGEDIDSAIHAPRLHNEGSALDIEPGLLGDHERDRLMAMGWKLRQWQQQSIYFGGVHAIARTARGDIQACGDPRRGGAVAFA